jgi:replicative DNA helicase
MSTILDVARQAAAAGLSVVPPRQDGTKRPDGTWANYQTAPPTPAELDGWYAGGQRTGIGLVCGAVSGHLEMLEFEGRAQPLWKPFVQACAAAGLDDVLDRIVAGYAEKTPSGGAHLIYRSTEAVEGNLKLARQADGLPLIETRGEGGYVVVAPSNGGVHPSGGKWEIRSGGFDTIATITAAERSRLLDVARTFDQQPTVEHPTLEAPEARRNPSDGDGWMDATIADFNASTTWAQILGEAGWHHSHRHGDIDYWTRPGKDNRDGHSATTNANGTDRLIVFSSSVAGFDIADGNGPAPSYDRFGAWAVLHHGGDRLEAAKRANDDGHGPQWAPPSVVDWADILPPGHPDLEPHRHEATTSDRSDEPWPEPTPLGGGRRDLPPFPLHTLPAWMRSMAEDVARQQQVPIDLPALIGIGALATVCGGKIRVQVAAGWREHVNLYLAVAMPPSSGKSPAAKAMLAPVEQLEADLAKLHTKTAMEAAQRKAIAQKRAKELETKAAKTGSEHDIQDAVTAFVAAEETEVPKAPRLLSDDATPEALTQVLADNGGRITIASTEGGLFEMMTGRYSDGRANLDVYLKAWSSDPIRVDRIGRPAIHIPEPVVTVALAVQPSVLASLADRPELAGRGLTARFMYAVPVDLVGTRDLTRPRDADLEIRQTYNDAICMIGRRCSSWAVPADLTIAPDALGRYGTWRQSLEERRRPDADLRAVAEWTGKLEGTVLRLAALLHIADGGNPSGGQVDDETMARAIEIAGYWLAHALHVHDLWKLDPAADDARAILEWIGRTQPVDGVGPTDIVRGINRFRGEHQLLTWALEHLVDAGWIRTDNGGPVEVNRGRGKPSQRYLLHPQATDTTRANPREPHAAGDPAAPGVRTGSHDDASSGKD